MLGNEVAFQPSAPQTSITDSSSIMQKGLSLQRRKKVMKLFTRTSCIVQEQIVCQIQKGAKASISRNIRKQKSRCHTRAARPAAMWVAATSLRTVLPITREGQ